MTPTKDAYHDAAPGQCSATASSDDWGWAQVRCTKTADSHGSKTHISEGNATFGGVPFTAIWHEGDGNAIRYFQTGKQA